MRLCLVRGYRVKVRLSHVVTRMAAASRQQGLTVTTLAVRQGLK